MEPAEYMKFLADMWGSGGKSFMAAQQSMIENLVRRSDLDPGGETANASAPQPDPFAWGALQQSSAAFGELLSTALDVQKNLSAQMCGAPHDPLITQMLGKIFDPRSWLSASENFGQSVEQAAESSRLADLWENEHKQVELANAWLGLRKASLDHNKVALEGWMQAAGTFARLLNEKADRGETFESWRDVQALWVETANGAILKAQRSTPFLETQREVLNAATQYRSAQQEISNSLSQALGYPTHAELDDVYRSVTELRRELRALKKSLHGSSVPAASVSEKGS